MLFVHPFNLLFFAFLAFLALVGARPSARQAAQRLFGEKRSDRISEQGQVARRPTFAPADNARARRARCVRNQGKCTFFLLLAAPKVGRNCCSRKGKNELKNRVDCRLAMWRCGRATKRSTSARFVEQQLLSHLFAKFRYFSILFSALFQKKKCLISFQMTAFAK